MDGWMFQATKKLAHAELLLTCTVAIPTNPTDPTALPPAAEKKNPKAPKTAKGIGKAGFEALVHLFSNHCKFDWSIADALRVPKQNHGTPPCPTTCFFFSRVV